MNLVQRVRAILVTPKLEWRVIAGEPKDLGEYLQAMVDDQRLVFEFDITHAYGQF